MWCDITGVQGNGHTGVIVTGVDTAVSTTSAVLFAQLGGHLTAGLMWCIENRRQLNHEHGIRCHPAFPRAPDTVWLTDHGHQMSTGRPETMWWSGQLAVIMILPSNRMLLAAAWYSCYCS